MHAAYTHWFDQRTEISGQVLATDASEEGGITKWGRARIHTLAHELMTMEGEGSDPTVVIEAFAGIGGFSQALKLLGYNPIGVVGIDTAPESGRIMRQHVRHALWYDDIHKVHWESYKRYVVDFRKPLGSFLQEVGRV